MDRADFSFRTDSAVTQYEAVRHGVGIGGGQRVIFEQMSGVEPVLVDLDFASLPVWLVMHPDLRNSPPIRLLYERLARFFEELPT